MTEQAEDFLRNDHGLVFGDDQVRVEEGVPMVKAVATEELLHDDQTAPHYYAGVRDREFFDAQGKPFTTPALGRDAKGKVIVPGEEIHYRDYGGGKSPGSRCFFVFVKRPVDPTSPVLPSGHENPHYVDEATRKGAKLLDDGTPPNRTHYTYIFDEVAEIPIKPGKRDEAEAKAIERARSELAKLTKEPANASA